MRVEPSAKVVLNVHFSVVTAPPGAVDQPTLRLRTDVRAIEARPLMLTNPAWIIGDAMLVRAGDADAVFYYRYRPRVFTGGRRMWLRNVTPHMHTFERSLTVRVLRANGERACVLEIPRWRFGWEQPYWLQSPIELGGDDELYIECRFDSSSFARRSRRSTAWTQSRSGSIRSFNGCAARGRTLGGTSRW